MTQVSPFKSCITLSKEQIHENHSKTQTLLHASFLHGQHDAFKQHMQNNPVHQNFNGSLADGMKLVISKKRTMFDVEPTLIILLQNGAKLDHDHLIMPDGMTPYHVICRSTGDHQELLELMIKELGRSLVNAKDDDECTALIYAVSNANIKCVKSLIANGADVNLINDKPNGRPTSMGIMVIGPLINSIMLLNPNSSHSYTTMMGIFDLLLDSGADVNKPCHLLNRTPIMYAASKGNVNCVEKLIQKGAQVNSTDRFCETVWSLATRAESVDVLKWLIEDHGIDKNSVRENGFSVLFCAVFYKNIEAVRYLLKQGVTMTSFVPQECVETCKSCGTNLQCYHPSATQRYTDPYVLAIISNMLDVVRLMEEFGCQLYKYPEILSYAISGYCVDVVAYLLCNYKYPLNYGYTEERSGHQTFLNKACEKKCVEIVKLLLEHGADPNIKNCEEKCPPVINVAIYQPHVENLACFICGGVSVNTGSYYRGTFFSSRIAGIGDVLPFEVAIYENKIHAAEMLLVVGCSRGVHSLDNDCALKANIGSVMQELLKEWNVHKNYVLPLKKRCRMVILNHLCPQADKKITELPLPTPLIKYLNIPELDDIVKRHLSANH